MAPLRGQRRTQFGRITEAAVGTNIQNMESEPEGTGRRPQVSRQNLGTWRFGNFLFPFWTQVPNGEFGRHVQVADGCRSTMSTPCTVCCGGSAAYRP
jgi:hypothetical protein